MFLLFQKIFFNFLFNSSLFLLLLIGIQNSSEKNKVIFLMNETIKLPISFIIGSSFICGSTIGSILNFDLIKKKQ